MICFKRFAALALAFALSIGLAACGGASNPNEPQSSASGSGKEASYTLKFAHEMAEGTPEAIAADLFAENVHEKTNGAVTIEVFPHGQLGDPATMIESASLGNIDLISCASGNFARFDTIFNIDTVPYLYADGEAFRTILKESGAQDTQMDVLSSNGFTMLNEARNCFRGPYRVLVSTRPINTIDDLKGLRLRAFENTNYMTAYEKLGANPIILPWSDVFMSLQQGTVEAAACAIGSLKNEGFTQVAPYVANVNEYLSSILIVGTESALEKLPPEYIEILKECADQFGEDVDTAMNESLDEQIAAMEAEGATFVEVDTAPAREVLKGFYYSLEESGVLPKGTVDISLAQ